MQKTFVFLFCCLFIGAMMGSCGSEPKLLSEAEMMERVDSIYMERSAELETELNELCDAKLDQYVKTAVDSILVANGFSTEW